MEPLPQLTSEQSSAPVAPPLDPPKDTYQEVRVGGSLDNIARSIFDQILIAPLLNAGISSYDWNKEFAGGLEPITPAKLAHAVLVVTKLVEQKAIMREMKMVEDTTVDTYRLVCSLRSEFETSIQLCNKNMDAINGKLAKTETKKVTVRTEPASSSPIIQGFLYIFGFMSYVDEQGNYRKPNTPKVTSMINASDRMMKRVATVTKFLGAKSLAVY